MLELLAEVREDRRDKPDKGQHQREHCMKTETNHIQSNHPDQRDKHTEQHKHHDLQEVSNIALRVDQKKRSERVKAYTGNQGKQERGHNEAVKRLLLRWCHMEELRFFRHGFFFKPYPAEE